MIKSVIDLSLLYISLFNCVGFSDVGLPDIGKSNIGYPNTGSYFCPHIYCVYNSLVDLFCFEIEILRSRGQKALNLCGFQSVKFHQTIFYTRTLKKGVLLRNLFRLFLMIESDIIILNKTWEEILMNEIYTTELLSLGTTLAELAVKGTATAVSTKIRAIKEEKNIDKIRNTYDEIISELLNEREEAVRIAQAYKSELEKVVISDEDIQHLHNTVSRILEIIKKSQIASAEQVSPEAVETVKSQVESYEQIKELISVDTLKTMQLIGFNYKSAIGEPLTLMLKNFILSKVTEPDSLKAFEKIVTPEMVEILKDDTAYENFKKITGIQ